MHAQIDKKNNISKQAVLTKAIQRLADELELSREELSLIMGPSKATLSRLFKNDAHLKGSQPKYLEPSSKEGQLAILLLRVYQSLNILFGGNVKQSQLWLRSDNEHLGSKPIELIQSIKGLVIVVQYLDVMRDKN